MKAVVCEKVGEPWKVVDNLPTPEPSPDQILVKSIYTAINPADWMMASMGVLVQDWPLVAGLDAAGVVVKVGENAASSFKVGDHVCGCTRLGAPGYSAGQEYFLMDANVTIPKPSNVTLVEAATIGVGALTSALGLFGGLDVKLPELQDVKDDKEETLAEPGEWAVVLGGASSVGKFGSQILKACGYKVIASCSAKSVALVKQSVDAVFDYNKPVEEQVKEVLSVTKGNIHRVYDAAATGIEFASALFKELPNGPKLFATTNSWSGITDFEGATTNLIQLAAIGRPDAEQLNNQLASYIPVLVAMFEKKKLLPSPYDLIGEGGFECAIEALNYQKTGAGGANKVVVKIQDE
ncbi:hypothetical protein AJ80_07957 [Polytolypa hystricis UAMH7299]|uniref:Enoyl reductase (ER) domain-containing protein n=1 Tax=Polytolypa hystricis (strain UAMH7299) TaxID=1447883 RepID=A0A2B7XGB7_POLH7|nr:hypothetical protein AJ80_07957 [Polytolypa hystricis UAMH7299]